MSKNKTTYILRKGEWGLYLLPQEWSYRILWVNYSWRRLDFFEFQKMEAFVIPSSAAS